MIRVAWLTCALVALTSARIYDRCELARDLERFGMQREHISTWVCIAEHESQYDTAAQNHGSGDHGIFQISELYWCGPGKACGVPCTAFRDDDIQDDIECSLIIHKEHTRLQGDGFLAWVVYGQHCKQNTKKYLAGCDGLPKNITTKTAYKTFANDYFEKNATIYRSSNQDSFQRHIPQNFQQNYQQQLSYLVVSQLFEDSFNDFERNYDGSGVKDWSNYKIDNVDELTLPQFTRGQNVRRPIPQTTTTKTTTTTTTTYAPPVVPRRYIETNQFRNKIVNGDKDALRPSIGKNYDTPRYVIFDTTYSEYNPKSSSVTSLAYTSPISSTTYKPEIISRSSYSLPTTYRYPAVTTTFSPPTTRSLPSPYPVYQSTITLPKLNPRTPQPLTTKQPWYNHRQTFRTEPTIRETFRPFATRPWTTAAPTTRRAYSTYRSPLEAYRFSSTTHRSVSVTHRSPLRSTAYRSTRPTQSIFDLYLNPTKPPKLPSFSFFSQNDSPYKFKIFSGGTTTPAPSNLWGFKG